MKKILVGTISLLVLVAAISFVVLKRSRHAPQEVLNTPAQNVQNIVFISIDTLRADHLSCYGYPRETSPFLDTMAEKGTIFKNAFAQMPTTAPSHTTMLTGLYPLEHNVQKNGLKLDDSFVTLAEVLQKNGFKTAGFASTNTHFTPSNIAQGFSHFDEPTEEYIRESVQNSGKKYREANDTINSVINWLKTEPDEENLFLFVHLFDPHRWLNPPQQYIDELSISSPDRDTLLKFLTNEHHLELEYFKNDKNKLLETIDKYDGEIRYVDSELKRLFEFISQNNKEKKTLWIVTADHGEGFGAHMYGTHGKNIYNEQIHVPLIFYPSLAPSSQIIGNLVEHVDLMPTITELAGLNIEKILPYKLEGFSLAPLLKGQKKYFPRTLSFSQRRFYEEKSSAIAPPQTIEEYEAGEKYATQNDKYKYIMRSAYIDEFYNIKDDPYEVYNLIGRTPELENSFKNEIKNKVGLLEKKFSTRKAMVDKKQLRTLRTWVTFNNIYTGRP